MECGPEQCQSDQSILGAAARLEYPRPQRQSMEFRDELFGWLKNKGNASLLLLIQICIYSYLRLQVWMNCLRDHRHFLYFVEDTCRYVCRFPTQRKLESCSGLMQTLVPTFILTSKRIQTQMKVNRSFLDILQTADDHECSNIVKTRRERSSTNVLIGLELV